MDFQLYSLGAALVFHEIFFPEQSAAMALILAMGTYGAGYIARIVGAFIFGKMGTASGVKGSVYYHHHDGNLYHVDWRFTYLRADWHFAPVLLVTLRIIQGLGRALKFPAPEPCWRSMRQKANAASSLLW